VQVSTLQTSSEPTLNFVTQSASIRAGQDPCFFTSISSNGSNAI
jgi:hypothetical protein